MHILSDVQIIVGLVSIVIATIANALTLWARVHKDRAAIQSLDGGLVRARNEIAVIKKAVTTIEKAIAAQVASETRSAPYGRRATDKPADMRPPPTLGPSYDPKT